MKKQGNDTLSQPCKQLDHFRRLMMQSFELRDIFNRSSHYLYHDQIAERSRPKTRLHVLCSLILTLPERQILDSSKLKEFADDNLSLMRMAESCPKGYKTLGEKEKLLVTSNFSFSHSVFRKTCSANT